MTGRSTEMPGPVALAVTLAVAEARVRLCELQAEEIALAVATFDCGGGDDALGALRAEVGFEYEQEFLDEHAGELARHRSE